MNIKHINTDNLNAHNYVNDHYARNVHIYGQYTYMDIMHINTNNLHAHNYVNYQYGHNVHIYIYTWTVYINEH